MKVGGLVYLLQNGMDDSPMLGRMISNTPTDINSSVIITDSVDTYNCDFELANLATFELQEWRFPSHLVTLSKLLTKISAKDF